MTWDIVIGLEVHVQLCTKSKLFSSASTTYGATPNTQASYVDLALPGVLPVLNQEAVNMAIKFGLSIGADITMDTLFSRKNYFYPDLPKGYQISQDAFPILRNGSLNINMIDERFEAVAITRAHLEEDAGQSTHENEAEGSSGINLNRAGVPLLEIVTEPVIKSIPEAIAFLKSVRALVRYLGVSTGNMQEGALRCDANISVRPSRDAPLGQRVEIKNINSFKFVEKALNFEMQRQIQTLESGGKVFQETRLYDAKRNETRSMRSKEDAVDYRYFPDPDLTHVIISADDIARAKQQLPELPWDKLNRFVEDYRVSAYDARILCADPKFSDYFEAIVSLSNIPGKNVANWLCTEYLSLRKQAQSSSEHDIVSVQSFAKLLVRIHDNTISGSAGKVVLEALFNGQDDVDAIISEKGLKQISDPNALEEIIADVIKNNPKQFEQFKAGKEKLFGFFVGQVMQRSKGRANPKLVNELLKKALS